MGVLPLSVRDVAGPAKVAAATTYHTQHELRRETLRVTSRLCNVHMYTAHCSVTQHRSTRNTSPPSKLKVPRCEHWESAPVPTYSHAPVLLPLAALTPQQWRPRRWCTTPAAIESGSFLYDCFWSCCLVSAVFLAPNFLIFPKGRATLS